MAGMTGSGTRRLRWLAALALLLASPLVLGSLTALAAPVNTTTTEQPLPGSQFQGGDGNQDDNLGLGLIDWQGLQADGRVAHTSDPNANDNVFSGGDKEDEPGGWGLTTQNGGAKPGKGNILDSYSAIDRPPGGDVFLYLAFTRQESNGTTFVTFDLNQDARLWKNSQGALIPCRTTGDIVISFEPHGDGASIQVERWVTEGTDPTSGCATRGHLESASNLIPGVDVQASFNEGSAPINNYLPGFYARTTPQGDFGEAAINLSSVLAGLGHPCGVFASIWMHSRSSNSESSALQDYVAPRPISVRTCKASPELSSTASGSVSRRARGMQRAMRHQMLRASILGTSLSDIAHLSGGAEPTGTITFQLYGPNQPTCTGTPVFVFTSTVLGNGYYESGSYNPTEAGTYHWVVDYSGDQNNNAAGPTGCNVDDETVVVSPAAPSLSSSAEGQPSLRTEGMHRVASAGPQQEIYDVAELADGFSPTGTITFTLYGRNDPTCSTAGRIFTSTVPVSGNGRYRSEPFTPAAAGTYRWVASYSGDANNQPAGPTGCGVDAETVVINPATPAISTVASPATVLGSPISDRATLSGGAAPTGKITFEVYGPNNDACKSPPAASSTVNVSGNSTYESQPFKPTAPGTYRWVASYSGDANNTGAGPSPCGDPAESVIVTPALPPTQPDLASTASPGAPAGSAVTDSAQLSGGSNPTGTITFELYGPADYFCGRAPIFSSTVAVAGNGTYTSASFTATQAGTYHWVASYSGDETNRPAGPIACGDAAETVLVSRAQPMFTTTALAGVTLGEHAYDTAVLSDGSRPTGTITFHLYGPNDAACSRPPVFGAQKTVVGNGVYVSPTFAPRHAGTYLWVATYSGDANNAPAATRCGDHGETLVVQPRQPALLTVAGVPSRLGVRHETRAAGLSIIDAATLSGGSAPSGEITFFLYGPDDATCSRTPVFTTATAVTGNGTYNSEPFTPTASGAYRWLATYSGDANHHPAGPTACGDSEEQVSVTLPANPELTSTASQAVTIGGAVHDRAHLSGGAGPTGTMTFRLFGPEDTACSGEPAFTSTVAVAGNNDYASESFVPTAAGVYRWVVGYSGDAHNNPSGPTACGDSAEITIVRSASTIPVDPVFSTTASQATEVGTSLYDVAHLSGGLDPGGNITFTLFGPGDQSCSSPPVFTTIAAVTGNGDYRSPEFVAPRPGTYRWVATYSGDANNTGTGPTRCGESAETVSLIATTGPSPDPGPNATAARFVKPYHEAKPPSPPPVTG